MADSQYKNDDQSRHDEGNAPHEDTSGTESRCRNCTKSEEQYEEYKSGWQRAVADYQNLQKEVAARRAELAQISERQILEEFIPVYDNFKKAFQVAVDTLDEKWENWRAGIGYIMRQFGDILKAHNVEEIKTVGEKFDARLHEAVGEESQENTEQGVIIREVDGGYLMGGRVIKPAKVVINK